jgi:hypothetical protein
MMAGRGGGGVHVEISHCFHFPFWPVELSLLVRTLLYLPPCNDNLRERDNDHAKGSAQHYSGGSTRDGIKTKPETSNLQ